MRTGFDNDKYLKMQSDHIRERIGQFGDKLYLEFGGKLFDDFSLQIRLKSSSPSTRQTLRKTKSVPISELPMTWMFSA